MGVVNNEIRIAGLEANTAGMMSSIRGIEANTAGLMASVSKNTARIAAMRTGVEILKEAQTLSGSTDIVLKNDVVIFNYHNISVKGYRSSNSGGKRFAFNIDVASIVGIADINVEYMATIGDEDALIILAKISEAGVLTFTARNGSNQLVSGITINSIIAFE